MWDPSLEPDPWSSDSWEYIKKNQIAHRGEGTMKQNSNKLVVNDNLMAQSKARGSSHGEQPKRVKIERKMYMSVMCMYVCL